MASPTATRAIFITLEGPDGAGKSTAGTAARRAHSATGREVVETREPGGTALGERLRDVLMHAPDGSHDALSDALLFNAARARQVSEVIRPALDRGAVVVCDRFSNSTLAYQGYGGGVPQAQLRDAEADRNRRHHARPNRAGRSADRVRPGAPSDRLKR